LRIAERYGKLPSHCSLMKSTISKEVTMSSQKTRFADKHPQSTVVSEKIRKAVHDQMNDQGITCEAAHRLAARLNVSAQQVGIAIDMQEGRIRQCQLGLFGHGAGHKPIQPADSVTPELRSAIENSLLNGRLPCMHAWRIAETAGLSRPSIAQACETLKIKISKCQLGAF
jgi:hypothetical protein